MPILREETPDHYLPKIYRPEDCGGTAKSALLDFISSSKATIDSDLLKAGALLFRGFELDNPQDFEDVARAVDPGLKNNYLGTSPRNKRSEYTFSASELPAHYPIMQHCEMSFLPGAPRKLFFFCTIEPAEGGETPICDFRKVWSELPEQMQQDFRKKGVMHVRNYGPPNKKPLLDLWQLKSWDAMFGTTDKASVEEQCRSNGIEFEWTKKDGLRLINRTDAYKAHPMSGEECWFNHTQVFHSSAAGYEYMHINGLRPSARAFGVLALIRILTNWKQWSAAPMDHATNVFFGDGSPIPEKYVSSLLQAIWKNLVIIPWRKGDLLAIDNFSTAHGRLPYSGDREILVCWAADN